MYSLFNCIALLSIICLIVGLIKPKLVMWPVPLQKRYVVIIFYFLILVISANVAEKYHPHLSDSKTITLYADTTETYNKSSYLKHVAIDEKIIAKNFKAKFDSVTNDYIHTDHIFSNYKDQISPVLKSLQDTIKSLNQSNLKTKVLNALFITEERHYYKNQLDYEIYGDGDDITLRASAETFLNENALDPGSLNIQDAYKCGKQKQGWVYYVRYRAKNPYGALILTDVKLLMRYDTSSSMYNILKAY